MGNSFHATVISNDGKILVYTKPDGSQGKLEKPPPFKAGDRVSVEERPGRQPVIKPTLSRSGGRAAQAGNRMGKAKPGPTRQKDARAKEFVNPYTMLPTPDRAGSRNTPWGDGPPPMHDRLLGDHLRGTLKFTITAQTPLLLLDSSDPKWSIVRRDESGEVQLDPTAVKGMLRSAFEAVSVSRFGVFYHPQQLAIRAPAKDAQKLRMARVLKVENDEATIRVINALQVDTGAGGKPFDYGSYVQNSNGRKGRRRVPISPPHEVWVPSYPPAKEVLPRKSVHGMEVFAWVHLVRHGPANTPSTFWIWRASRVTSVNDEGNPPKDFVAPKDGGQSIAGGNYYLERTVKPVLIRGTLLVGGQSYKKHDERIFVTDVISGALSIEQVDLKSSKVLETWMAVYDSYESALDRSAKRQDRSDKRQGLGRHQQRYREERNLAAGQLGFARVGAGATPQLEGMYPVLIGRLPFPKSPNQIMDPMLRPASSLEEFSPAERLFGWVGDSRGGTGRQVDAYRGHAWVERVSTKHAVIQSLSGFDQGGLQLPAQGAPKPTQYRFYLTTKDGGQLRSGELKSTDAGYAGRNKSIPRKFFRSNRKLPQGYWDPRRLERGPKGEGYEVKEVDGRFLEYAAPPGTKTNVSSRVKEWIKPGASFTVTVRFDNVEAHSLGLLLWLLTDSRLVYGLGYGKPLGFGAVKLSIDAKEIDITTGEILAAKLKGLSPTATLPDAKTLIEQATSSLDEVYPGHRERFVRISDLQELPVHTPRAQEAPVATTYSWFVDNERGNKLSLPTIEEPGLPYNP